MKVIKSPSSILQVARLYQPSVEGVKREVLRLVQATPTFSYHDLQKIIFDLLLGLSSFEQAESTIQSINYDLKRNSYARAIAPAWAYLQTLNRTYTIPIDQRFFPISRDVRVPCIPPMVCGTPSGQVVPWLMFWKKNVLREEQMALFVSMALEVMEQDGELEAAKLLVVDTSDRALDRDGMPSVIDCDNVGRLPHEKLSKMLGVFVQGFRAAAIEWTEMQRAQKGSIRKTERETESGVQQWLLSFGRDDQ